MKKIIEIKKELANVGFKSLQKKRIDQFQLIENEICKKNKKKKKKI